jgi:protein-S-isoprenylcysteine O-methyltransferase Ste14
LRPAGNRFALWTGVKIVVAAIVLFVLVRIAIPDLVDAHNTPLLLLAIVCGFLAAAIAIWTAVSIWRAWRRLRRTGANLIEARK